MNNAELAQALVVALNNQRYILQCLYELNPGLAEPLLGKLNQADDSLEMLTGIRPPAYLS